MKENWRFWLNRLKEKLWLKPLVMCGLSIVAAFLAMLADGLEPTLLPDVSTDSIVTLLELVASTMLVIAMFAVGSMVAAYSSASNSATPRSFPLVLADDTSQNALSTFIGVFIFSVVALIALKNNAYGQGGRFALFVFTVFVFALVILAFLRWVDNIARLGRLGHTVDKVERVTFQAMRIRMQNPYMGGVCMNTYGQASGVPLALANVGYLQRVDMAAIQAWALARQLRVGVLALPGTFCTPAKPVLEIYGLPGDHVENPEDTAPLLAAFHVADHRTFDQDPRFGVVVLSEIASRALSPAVNDPGTAIDVIGTLVRLFHQWEAPPVPAVEPVYPNVLVPSLRIEDLFDDAFTAIARDGATLVEVAIRLLKGLQALAEQGDEDMRRAAIAQAATAVERFRKAMPVQADVQRVEEAAAFARFT
ncbi:DUF2254 domain-containing protein [Limnobacter sp.]|uniref:DUF2254 domain-containing protein n=1 Tax=Limnobacter sp. TaxID=2003368 RepID=UPI0035180B9D